MKQKVFIPGDVICEIFRMGENAYPYEGCGVLLGRSGSGAIAELVVLPNRETEGSGRFFRLDPLKVYRTETEAEKNGMEIVGYCHSHADAGAVLSAADTEYMIPWMISVVVSVCSGIPREMRAYRKTADGEVKELLILTKPKHGDVRFGYRRVWLESDRT